MIYKTETTHGKYDIMNDRNDHLYFGYSPLMITYIFLSV